MSGEEETKSTAIDIQKINSLLHKYNSNTNSLDLHLYLEAYKELKRFLEIFGKVFHFVTKDIESKINILEEYIQDNAIGDNYKTLQSMIEYEKKNKLLRKDDRPSGCRTLLRLHRALEFISVFTHEISKLNNQEATGPAARRSYQKTLAKYHPWIIRQTASVAMIVLPPKDEMAARALSKPKSDSIIEEVSQEMSKLSETSETCYNITQKLFEDNNLLDLP